ncbi:hypothetical protein, partial [Vibrio vulnificus]|uniref:hypothetical protein n=1 Tax=Vibrio vulnificus TaxID=672 RepID=UPI0019D492F6
ADHGKQFDSDSFRGFCEGLHIRLSLSSVAYLQSNRQAESSNKTSLNGLKTRLDKGEGARAKQLPNILWAYRTTPRVSTGETPFNLTYGSEALIPVEISLGSARTNEFNEKHNSKALRQNLDLIEEEREKACTRLSLYH